MSGGDSYGGETGFLGCMRNLHVQGIQVTDIPKASNIGNVVNGSCDLEDRFFLSIISSAVVCCRYKFLCVFEEGGCVNSSSRSLVLLMNDVHCTVVIMIISKLSVGCSFVVILSGHLTLDRNHLLLANSLIRCLQIYS